MLEFGSVAEVDTDAELLILVPHVYEDEISNTTVYALLEPLLRVRLLQSMEFPCCTQSLSEAPELKVRPDGIGSATTTFVAVSGPWFLALRV